MISLSFTLFLLIGIIYLTPFRPIIQMEGFWLFVAIIWIALAISRFLVGDIADELAGVNKFKDNDDN